MEPSVLELPTRMEWIILCRLILATREVDLGLVTSHHDLAVHTKSREEHLHLGPGGILCLVQDDERIVEGRGTPTR